jgi:hypothetical protein
MTLRPFAIAKISCDAGHPAQPAGSLARRLMAHRQDHRELGKAHNPRRQIFQGVLVHRSSLGRRRFFLTGHHVTLVNRGSGVQLSIRGD